MTNDNEDKIRNFKHEQVKILDDRAWSFSPTEELNLNKKFDSHSWSGFATNPYVKS